MTPLKPCPFCRQDISFLSANWGAKGLEVMDITGHTQNCFMKRFIPKYKSAPEEYKEFVEAWNLRPEVEDA